MITSRENPLIKLCRRLQSGARVRREEGLFVAEGARLCREALRAGVAVQTLLATPEAAEKNPWLREVGVPVQELSPGVAAAISDTKSPQGVYCLCAIPAAAELAIRPEGRYLLLDSLQDPGNLGTILRGAEAFGITAVILGRGCPDRFSPKVLRSTMGSAFRGGGGPAGDHPADGGGRRSGLGRYAEAGCPHRPGPAGNRRAGGGHRQRGERGFPGGCRGL